MRALVGAAAAGLAALGGALLWQARPASETAPPGATEGVGAHTAHAGGADGHRRADDAPPPDLVPASRQRLRRAQAAVPFPLHLPDTIDGWFPLARVQVTGATTGAARVALWYIGNGGYLRLVQGPDVAPEPAAPADWPAAERGETTVRGRPASWSRGTLVPAAGGLRAWRPGPVRLHWTTAAGIGYLLESDFYAPDQLVQLAATVAPCAPPTPAGRERPAAWQHRPVC